jgi:hypothetical protein
LTAASAAAAARLLPLLEPVLPFPVVEEKAAGAEGGAQQLPHLHLSQHQDADLGQQILPHAPVFDGAAQVRPVCFCFSFSLGLLLLLDLGFEAFAVVM